jgi:Zn-dependent peptidase ImmA (M78 family)
VEDLTVGVPALPKWLEGTATPTYPQLEKFARSTYVPFGALFLSEPPEEKLTITDFRVLPGTTSRDASPNLIDTIDICLLRQNWYRDYRERMNADELSLIDSLSVSNNPLQAAQYILRDLRISSYAELSATNLDEAFRLLSEKIESLGIMVMVNGIVGLNTKRKLDFREFRGFALSDKFAPLIFVNGTDSKAAKIFTLVHELAHLYLGDSGVSSVEQDERTASQDRHERWCNAVASEFLVPENSLRSIYNGFGKSELNFYSELDRLARQLNVSTLTVLLRLKSFGLIGAENFDELYSLEVERATSRFSRDGSSASGGNFYNAQGVRTGKLFPRALIADTLRGSTLHRDAFRLLGIKTHATFQRFAETMGVA